MKFTFDYLIANEGLAGTEGIRGVLPFVENIEAPDDTTVTFAIKQVCTPALYDIGEQMIVPEHLSKDVADPTTFTNENPVGTGPFTEIGAFQPQYYEIHKNPNSWQEGKSFIYWKEPAAVAADSLACVSSNAARRAARWAARGQARSFELRELRELLGLSPGHPPTRFLRFYAAEKLVQDPHVALRFLGVGHVRALLEDDPLRPGDAVRDRLRD